MNRGLFLSGASWTLNEEETVSKRILKPFVDLRDAFFTIILKSFESSVIL